MNDFLEAICISLPGILLMIAWLNEPHRKVRVEKMNLDEYERHIREMQRA